MIEPLQIPRELADQLLRRVTGNPNNFGVGRVYRGAGGNYFCIDPGETRDVDRTDKLFALFMVADEGNNEPDKAITADISKSTLLLVASVATKGVLELRAWQCESGKTEQRPVEIADREE